MGPLGLCADFNLEIIHFDLLLCCVLQITLAENQSDFEEFVFPSRRASWVKFTVKKVYGGSGGVGIQEIELYNEMCHQSKLFNAKNMTASVN